jgi:glycerophosphoryl diester phosphodiesterase
VSAVGPAPAAGGRTLRLAHRGDWRRAAENTIPAFLAALEVPGCDGLEFDVRAARDGVAVCNHDDTLLRVHGVDRRVDELTADELEALGVPTLEAALAAIPRRAFLDVELKGDPGRAAFEALVAGRGAALQRAVVSSFEPAALERIAGYAPA